MLEVRHAPNHGFFGSHTLCRTVTDFAVVGWRIAVNLHQLSVINVTAKDVLNGHQIGFKAV